MAIVATYKFGKCIAKVDDSCVVKTQEEIDGILNRLYKIYEASELIRIRKEQAKEAERQDSCTNPQIKS